jgi:hypothetical protein
MTADVEKSTTVKRESSSKGVLSRSRPFVSVGLVALLVVPLFCVVLRTFVWVDKSLTWPIVWLSLFLFGTVTPLVVLGIGYKVTKRAPFVIWHVVGTVEAFAVAVSLAVLPGWDHERAGSGMFDAIWWKSVTDIFTVPAGWVLAYLFGASFVSMTWWLHRSDALRSAARGETGGQSGLEKLLKWPLGVSVRDNTITSDEFAIEADIDHAGVPVGQVQGALPALTEQAGAIRGRSTVIPGDVGGKSKLRLVMRDPLTEWKPWPGLSHPGGSFAYPFRTAYYVNGKAQWFSFAQTPDPEILPVSRLAPKFRAANDASFGRQGATRAGKSGDNAIEIAEAASRNDAILILVNAAKLLQDVGWALEFATLAADTKPKAHLTFDLLRKIGEHRSAAMGDPRLNGRHRTWTPATYRELGFAALLVEVDEGDQVLSGSVATWLATKGLSLGIYTSVMISRAATDGMASTLRSAITQWKAFGAGQAYDGGFVLSDETIAAGADVGSLSTRFPGSHYLDKAQGVDERMYPELARSYQTARDFSDLRQAVSAARATFDPPTLTEGEVRAAGGYQMIEMLSPRTILLGAYAQIDGGTTNDPAPVGANNTKEVDMQATLNLDEDGNRPDDTGDPEIDALLSKPRADFSDLEAEYGPLPSNGEPMPNLSNPDLPQVSFDDGRPKVSPEQIAAEFDAALIRLARKGAKEVTNGDVMAEMRCDPTPSWVSKRFKAICDDGKIVAPPGLSLERTPGKAGRYLLVSLDPAGAVTAGDAHGG